MEAVAQPPPDTSSDRTATSGGGVASDRLRVHAHFYKPRLKTSSLVPDFQAELRQYASKQGRAAALEYATALGTPEAAPCTCQVVNSALDLDMLRNCLNTWRFSGPLNFLMALLIPASSGHAQALQGGLS